LTGTHAGDYCIVTANTATTVTCTMPGGWANGNAYKISNGYPCRDQIGRGKDSALWSDYLTFPAPSQALEPSYVWNVRIDGVLDVPTVDTFAHKIVVLQ